MTKKTTPLTLDEYQNLASRTAGAGGDDRWPGSDRLDR